MRPNRLLTASTLAIALAAGACGKNGSGAGADAPAADAPNAAMATAPAPPTTPASTQDFVTTAAISDMYEIAAAKVAQKRSTNAAVKAFAAKMIHDHSATTAAVKAMLADGKASASPPDAMDDAHAAMIAALDKAPTTGFDKTYMDQQVAAHNAAVTLFKTYAAQGDNPALKAFASDTEPKIETHLNMAQKLDDSVMG